MTPRFKLLSLVLLSGIACASTTTASTDKAASSSASIRAAEEVGATHNPDAAFYLQLAKEQFEHARLLTDKKDKDWADRLRMRAQVDAELSLALARTESEKADARGAIDKVRGLNASTIQ